MLFKTCVPLLTISFHQNLFTKILTRGNKAKPNQASEGKIEVLYFSSLLVLDAVFVTWIFLALMKNCTTLALAHQINSGSTLLSHFKCFLT